jgi:lipoate-protein ligase A
MALDEALLLSGDAPPTLRFYTWQPAALSLGYFQRWAELEPLARGLAVVRRLTGGGAIHHADELTFSIAAPLDHPLYRGELRDSYQRVHALLARAFADYGVAAGLRGTDRLSSDRPRSELCFQRSTALDLAWDGAKGVGSAQRRSGARVLHHGSIKLAASALEPGVASLRTHAPGLCARDLAERIGAVFAAELGLELQPGEPTPEELRRTARRAAFFGSDAFLRRR